MLACSFTCVSFPHNTGAVEVLVSLIEYRALAFEKISRRETQHLSRFARIITTPVAIKSAIQKFAAQQILTRKLPCRCLHECIGSTDIESLMTRETCLDGQPTGHCGVSNIDIGPERSCPS